MKDLPLVGFFLAAGVIGAHLLNAQTPEAQVPAVSRVNSFSICDPMKPCLVLTEVVKCIAVLDERGVPLYLDCKER